eukprot:g1279.t1
MNCVVPAALDSYFGELVDLVPSNIYIPLSDEQKELQWRKRRKLPLPESAMHAERIAKRQKFDPSHKSEQRMYGRKVDEPHTYGKNITKTKKKKMNHQKGNGRISHPDELRARLRKVIEARQNHRTKTPHSKTDKHSSRHQKEITKRERAKAALQDIERLSKARKEAKKKASTIEFSEIDGGQTATDYKAKTSSIHSKPLPGSSKQRLQKLLRTAEAKASSVWSLKQAASKGDTKAQSKLSSIQYERAMALATGEKVIDTPAAIKKSLKRKEKAKAKSKQRWAGIEQEKKDALQEKVARRETNLANKKIRGTKAFVEERRKEIELLKQKKKDAQEGQGDGAGADGNRNGRSTGRKKKRKKMKGGGVRPGFEGSRTRKFVNA